MLTNMYVMQYKYLNTEEKKQYTSEPVPANLLLYHRLYMDLASLMWPDSVYIAIKPCQASNVEPLEKELRCITSKLEDMKQTSTKWNNFGKTRWIEYMACLILSKLSQTPRAATKSFPKFISRRAQ